MSNTEVTPIMQRVRHEFRSRHVQLLAREQISPGFIRLTLGGPELEGFVSAGFDDHTKLILPQAGLDKPNLPQMVDGRPHIDGERPTMRDYTPQQFDPQALTLVIDFALHDAGPATTWAAQAQVGQVLGVGGPRGSFILPTDFDGHLLIGDDTAIPAIARRLAELPAGAPALVLIEVDGPEDEHTLASAAQTTVVWVHRRGQPHGQQPLLLERLRSLDLPPGDIHAWVGCETHTAKALRAHLVGERGVQPQWTKAAGYWRQGSVATHDTIEA